jgi:two-component system LytT family response regulator
METKMKAVLVDDEEHCIETLKWQLERHCPTVEVVKGFMNPMECLKYLMYNDVDLLFLDIEMPVLNGFDLLNALPKKNFGLIFTTAYDEFAIKAIKQRAIDYLLKPIDRHELEKAVQLAWQNKIDLEIRLSELMRDMDIETIEKLAITTRDGVELVNTSEIMRCESESNYTHIYMSTGKKYMISKTLKEVEEQLFHKTFVRVHQSHLVNFDYVKKYLKGPTCILILSDDTEIPVSRRKKNEFIERIH